MKIKILLGILATLALTAAYAYEIRHPNLRAAHEASEQAITHVHEAYEANKVVGFGGHAERAIDLLKQAQAEIVAADQYNDAHRK